MDTQPPVIEKVPTIPEDVVQKPMVQEEAPAAAPIITVQDVVEEVQENEPRKLDRPMANIFNVPSAKKPRAKKISDDIFIKVVHRKKVAIDRPHEKENLCPLDHYHKELEFLYNYNSTEAFFFEDETMTVRPTRDTPLRAQVEHAEVEKDRISVARSKTMGASSLKSPTVESSTMRTAISHHTTEMDFVPVIGSTPIIEERPVLPLQSSPPSLIGSTPIRAPADTQLQKLIRKDLRYNYEKSMDDAEKMEKLIHMVDAAQRRGDLPLKLEQLADRPLTKKTVASAFGHLLSLHALEYVELIPEDNSSALSHINLGKKLKRGL